jgi:hypothetical protein
MSYMFMLIAWLSFAVKGFERYGIIFMNMCSYNRCLGHAVSKSGLMG